MKSKRQIEAAIWSCERIIKIEESLYLQGRISEDNFFYSLLIYQERLLELDLALRIAIENEPMSQELQSILNQTNIITWKQLNSA